MKITAQMLRDKGACKNQVETFENEWPNGCNVTRKNCLRAAELRLDFNWAAGWLLSADALAAYDKAVAPALAAYKKAKADALAAYKKAKADAWTVHNKAAADALAAYEKATADAFYTASRIERSV